MVSNAWPPVLPRNTLPIRGAFSGSERLIA
jgi:hypothetical protein